MKRWRVIVLPDGYLETAFVVARFWRLTEARRVADRLQPYMLCRVMPVGHGLPVRSRNS